MRIASSPVYVDTSALAKLCVAEAESRLLERAVVGRRDLLVSIALESAVLIHRTLVQHLMVEVLQRVIVDGSAHRDAERLVMRFGDRIPLRAADAMHLALVARSGARSFVTFDRRLTFAARVYGEFDLLTP